MFLSRRSLAVLALLLAAVLISGCGRKAALIPPQKLVPVAISDLRYILSGNRVRLEWTYPAKMESGEELHGVEAFEIIRAGIPEEDFCEGCPVRFDKPVSVDGEPSPAAGGPGTAYYEETGLQVGYRYLYKIRSRAGWWYPSKDSNVVSFIWRLPPKAPGDVQIEAGDGQLNLSWEAVTENIAGNPLGEVSMYQVYRKNGETGYAALGEPVLGVEFIDTGLKDETPYLYRVQTLVEYTDSLQRSEFSPEKTGIPRDLQPPDQPGSLVAIAIPEGVKLAWQAVLDDDLAGYRIYRRGDGAAEPELIAEVAPDQNQYVDRGMPGGMKLFYSIIAFDDKQPPNESLPSTESVVDF